METTTINNLNLPDGLLPDRVARGLAGELSRVRGLSMRNAHQGRLTISGFEARVSIESEDLIRVVHETESPPSPLAALEATQRLPGNVRFAVAGKQSLVLADTRVDGQSHLRETFRLVKHGLKLAIGESARKAISKHAVDVDAVESALARSRFNDDEIVRLGEHAKDGWEIRPMLRGDAVPVRATIDGQELRLRRTVVTDLSKASDAEALAHQALRFNARVRHCRLASNGKQIVAEVRLHGGQMTATWMEYAARAVAVASGHCRTTLEILAGQPAVDEFYRTMFLSP